MIRHICLRVLYVRKSEHSHVLKSQAKASAYLVVGENTLSGEQMREKRKERGDSHSGRARLCDH